MAYQSMSEKAKVALQAMDEAKAQEAGKVGSYLERKDSGGGEEVYQPMGISQGSLPALTSAGPNKLQGAKFEAVGGGTQIPDEFRYRMYDDYDFKMRPSQYEAMEDNRKEFERNIATFRSDATAKIGVAQADYDANKSIYDKSVTTAQQELTDSQNAINDAKSRLGSAPTPNSLFENWWSSESKVPVRVVNGNTIEATYYVPKSILSNWDSSKGSLSAGYVDGGSNYNIEVRQGGRIRGAEMHSIGRDLSNKSNIRGIFFDNPDKWYSGYQSALKEYNDAVSALNTAQANHNTANTNFWNSKAEQDRFFSNYLGEIESAKAERDHQINLAETKRQGTLDELKAQYEAISRRRQLAYKNLSKSGAGYQPGAQNG